MIKEFFRQIAIHIGWLLENPLALFRIIKSFICYLWNGFSEYDLMDTDAYILQKLDDILPAFIKHQTGYPHGFTNEEQWKKELGFFKRNIHRLLTDNLDYRLEDGVKKEISDFLGKHIWDLWF